MTQALLIDNGNDVAARRARSSDLTPQGLVVDLLIALDELLAAPPPITFDPCAGGGIWGQAERELWPGTQRLGVDVRAFEERAARHYDAFAAGVDCRSVVRCESPAIPPALVLGADAAITNPDFSLAFERGDGKGKARVPRPSLVDDISRHLPRCRLIAFLGTSQTGQRGESREVFADNPPILQLRATAPVACRGGSATDARDYSLWVWADASPTIFTAGVAETLGWIPPGDWLTRNVPAVSTCGACYRWEHGRPGDSDLSPALVERLREAANRRASA